MKKSKKKVDKIDQETLEQFAKEKNIDKNKIENIAKDAKKYYVKDKK